MRTIGDELVPDHSRNNSRDQLVSLPPMTTVREDLAADDACDELVPEDAHDELALDDARTQMRRAFSASSSSTSTVGIVGKNEQLKLTVPRSERPPPEISVCAIFSLV